MPYTVNPTTSATIATTSAMVTGFFRKNCAMSAPILLICLFNDIIKM